MNELSRRIRICVTSFFLLSTVSVSAIADLMPDYYEDAGVSADRDYLNQSKSEYIDPFSGTLNLIYTDLVVPGTGGMDIKIQRSYTNHHIGTAVEDSPVGIGWKIHFGRVIQAHKAVPDFCNSGTVTTTDNPVLELPDGSNHLLVAPDTSLPAATFVTKDLWKAECHTYTKAGNTVTGLIVWSPDGTKYDMSYLATEGNRDMLYPEVITDRNGNALNVVYRNNQQVTFTSIDSVTSSDGRSVTFTYTDKNTVNERLTSISSNGKNWNYSYTKETAVTVPSLYYLTKVERPETDKLYWGYDYYPVNGTGYAGEYSVKKVTHPHGGYVNYTYQSYAFDSAVPGQLTTSIHTKSTSDGGSWTYAFGSAGSLDKTTVTINPGTGQANRVITYKHFGLAATSSSTLWKIGLLQEKNIDNGLQVETYTWGDRVVSQEDYVRQTRIGSHTAASDFRAPVLLSKTTVRDGTNYIATYSGHDVYGNPSTVVEDGYDGGGAGPLPLPRPTRTTTQTYKYLTGPGQWILHLLDTTKVNNIESVKKTYDTKGNMLTESQFGIPETYTYYSNGDINTYKDKNNSQTTYSVYKLGVAQTEKQAVNQPEMVTIGRTVNNTGTIGSVTNGEGNTTSYGYDGLGQLTSITPPATKTAINIAHHKTSRVVTRGPFKQTVAYDGFGRALSITSTDTAGSESVAVQYHYNALGEKIFESYPSAAPSNLGIDYGLDALGRLRNATYYAGGMESFDYLVQNKVKFTDQKGNITTYGYRSYGNPDERQLTKVSAPEGSITTINRDEFGYVSRINQDGKARDYTYYPNKYLWKITNPETGITTFGRDNAGNMTSRQVGTSPVTSFTYDGLNRLSTINYPVGTPDVIYSYYKTSKVKTITNGIGDRSYTYDVSDNLKTETLTIDGLTYTTSYDVNSLDHLNAITYPSGKTVTYSPNALGRSTQALPYVSTVTHHPSGVLKDVTNMNGVITNIALDARQRIFTINTSTNTPIGLTYGYDNNSNITSITDTYSPSYSVVMPLYDGLNRLREANGNWGLGSISYTPSGDIQTYTLGLTTTGYTYNPTSGLLETTSGLSPRSFTYDSYGNVSGNGLYTFTYNDASNLTDAIGATVTANYQYDGEGNRVSETKNSAKIHYVANKAGKLLGEYNTDGSLRRENIYLGNRLIAKVEDVPSAPPSISAPVNDPDGVYVVTWTPSTTAAVNHYQVFEATDAQFTNANLVYDGTATTANISGKTVGFYYYRVRACAAELCSDFTETTGYTFVGVIPGAPGALIVPAANDTGSYSIAWGISTGDLTEYQLDESTISNFSTSSSIYTGTQTTAPVTGQLSGSYYYRVRACYKSGTDSVCSPYTIGANSAVVDRIPQVPVSITVPTTESDGTYSVSWGPSDGYGKPIMTYQLFESTDPTFVGEISVYSGSGATANLTGRTIGTTYYYRVYACTDTKCSGFQTAATGVTPDGLPPGVPASIAVPVSNNNGDFFVTWTAASGDVANYELYQADNAAFTAETLVPDTDTKPLEERFYYQPTGTYYYRVRACNAVACSGYIAAVNSIAVIQPPPVPASITAPATDGDGTYTVSWIGSGGATFTHYVLTETTSSGSNVIYTGAAESFDINYREDGQYTYSLQACSVDACSPALTTVVTVQLLTGYSVQYQSLPQFDYTGSYTVSWSANLANSSTPPIASFILDESTDSNFSTINRRFTVQPGVSNSGSQLIAHSTNGTYYYRVRVCTGVDSCTAFIPGSHGVIETGIPEVDATKSYVIHWDSAQANGTVAPVYEVYQASNINFTDQTRIYYGSNLSMTISPPDDGYYYYRVRACPPSIGMCVGEYYPVYYHTREIGFKIFPAVMSVINTLLLN